MAIFNEQGDMGELTGSLQKWFDLNHPGFGQKIEGILEASAANGYSNETYIVELSDGDRLVLRLPPRYKSLFPHYDIPRQFAFMKALENKNGIPIAGCRFLEPDAKWLGRPFFLVDFVAGRVAPDNPMYLTGGWLFEASAAERKQVWWNTLDQLVRLSEVLPDRSDLERLDWKDSGHRTLQHMEWYERIAQWGKEGFPDRPIPLMDALGQWLRDNMPSKDPARIVWGDSRFGNIIYDAETPVALLDWELASIGDPTIDLAYMLIMHFYHELLAVEQGFSAKRLDGFPSDAETIEAYQSKTGQPLENYNFYWLFNAYKMFCMAQRMSGLQVEMGQMSVDEALDLRDLSVLAPFIEERMAG